MTVEIYPIQDNEYTDTIIDKVQESSTSYDLTYCNGWSFNIQKIGVVPHRGDRVRYYGDLGRPVRGIFINGAKIFYRTVEEQRKENVRLSTQLIHERHVKFEKDKVLLDSQYDSLPLVFQERISRFRDNNPNFRWEYESYELFTCLEAVKIANTLKTADKIDEFCNESYLKQLLLIPEISKDHSGNTFGAACFLSKLFLMDSNKVKIAHGALCPLVGCKKYGCFSTEKINEEI